MKGANFTSLAPGFEKVQWNNVFTAAVPALLAFGGYYTLSYMSGEIENPKRNLPLATIIGMLIVIIVNISLNITAIGTVGFKELAGSPTPVSAAAQVIFGPGGAIIVTIGALISIFGSLNGIIMSSPHVDYAMSRDRLIFAFFGKLHPRFKTPWITLAIFCACSIVFLWTGTFMTLLLLGVFVARSLECFVALSLIILRRKKPDAERPVKMWGYPVTTVLAIAITVILVTRVDFQQIINGLLLMASSIPAYFIFKATMKKSGLPD